MKIIALLETIRRINPNGGEAASRLGHRLTDENGLDAIETRRWARMDVNVTAIQTKPTEVG